MEVIIVSFDIVFLFFLTKINIIDQWFLPLATVDGATKRKKPPEGGSNLISGILSSGIKPKLLSFIWDLHHCRPLTVYPPGVGRAALAP